MRDKFATYKTWAPDGAAWTEWAKPVMFANMGIYSSPDVLNIPVLNWLKAADNGVMVIVDLPGAQGVQEGLALARMGYRPVPLYNGVKGTGCPMIVETQSLEYALSKGADELEKMTIGPDAPPVFLLDSRRMHGYGKETGKYDNRWCVFAQDMPSAAHLKGKGIHSVIVCSQDIQNDLCHILKRYHDQGIKVLFTKGQSVREITVVRPSFFKGWTYRVKVNLGLTRNATGGFGGKIPDQMSGSRYYGIG